MRKVFAMLIALMVLLAMAGCGDDPAGGVSTQPPAGGQPSGGGQQQSPEPTLSAEEKRINEVIATAGIESVTYEEVYEEPRAVFIKAQVPDYTTLLKQALETDNPKKAFADAITNKTYTTVEYEGYAYKTEDAEGKVTVDFETALESFVEQELIKAVNAVTEAEEGGSQA